MKIVRAKLYQIDLPLKRPFQTSAVYMKTKKKLLCNYLAIPVRKDSANVQLSNFRFIVRNFVLVTGNY